MRSVGVVTAIILAGSVVFAQPAQAPQPEEAKRLGFFVGKWEGESVPAEGKPQKVTESCEWYGTLNIICKGGFADGGEVLTVRSYDPATKMFFDLGAIKNSESAVLKLSVTPKTWQIIEFPLTPERIGKLRGTITETSATSYQAKMEMMREGKWVTVDSTTMKKIQ